MFLQIYIDSNDNELKDRYMNTVKQHNQNFMKYGDMTDAGFDLFAPSEQVMTSGKVNKLDYNVICKATIVDKDMNKHNTGFYMYPRSSISKSHLRLANNVGIIDAGYRGHLMGMFDVCYTVQTNINKFDRHLQICAPGLIPIYVELVDSLDSDTARGDGGFGSTGK
jgi:dUTP pyrophosphatase